MNNIEGLLYLLNQAGIALSQTESVNAQLAAENAALRQIAESVDTDSPESEKP